MNMRDTLLVHLRDVRDKKSTTKEFQEWLVDNSTSLESIVSRGAFLKLKKGEFGVMMNTLVELSQSCEKCERVGETSFSGDRNAFPMAISRIDDLCHSGSLEVIDQPEWVDSQLPPFVMTRYYRCKHCKSLWELAGPEREFGGSLCRIA